MTEHYDADVAIVGYGPTAITAALTLAQEGASVVAFERSTSLYERARAMTINDWTVRIFQSLGIGERVERKIERQRASRWMTYDGVEAHRVEHPPSSLGCSARFYNIYQPDLEAELRACAEERPGIAVSYGREVTAISQDDAGVTLTVLDESSGDSTTVRARYAIGADGGSSTTRSRIGVTLLGDTREITWIVIDCRVKRWWPDRNILTFWSDKERPVVDVALSAGNHRWEIPLMAGETAMDFPSQAEVWPLLERLGVTHDDVEIHQFAFYQHHSRMADRWRQGRVFLAGDAAHLMPPWAGSGMQSGIRDGYDLGWKLGRVLTRGYDHSWLDTYEAERRPNVAYYTALSERLGRVIRQEETAADAEQLDSRRDRTGDGKQISSPQLKAGWFRGIGTSEIVGRMAPQPLVGDTVGRIAPMDRLLGNDFVLLGNDVDPRALLTAADKAAWDRLGTRYLAVRPQSSYTQGPDELVDLDEVLQSWMSSFGARAVALRPDKFVAASDVGGLNVPAF